MKRFYKAASIAPLNDGFCVMLDDKAMRSPGGKTLCVPTHALAVAIAAEWNAVEETVDPQALQFTKYSNTAIDRGGPLREEIIAELTKFAQTDLVCYRAVHPERLAVSQSALWDPILQWMHECKGIALTSTTALLGHDQPPSALNAVAAHLDRLTAFELTALYNMATVTGSVSIAFARAFGCLDDAQAWAAATVDDAFQLREWGEDGEAMAALFIKEKDFLAASAFWTSLRLDI